MFLVLFTLKIRPTKGKILNPGFKEFFFYSLHWQASELLNCIPLKSNFFSETTTVFSSLLKSRSHNELVIKAESSGENNKYWRSSKKIKAQIQLLLAFTEPVGTHWCKWPEAFDRTSVNTWALKTETMAFGYIMAQYHKAIPVSLELIAWGGILKFKKLSVYS